MENFGSKGFHNIIVNVFDVILEYTQALLTHALYQLEPKPLLEVDVLVHDQGSITVNVKPILLIPSPE